MYACEYARGCDGGFCGMTVLVVVAASMCGVAGVTYGHRIGIFWGSGSEVKASGVS